MRGRQMSSALVALLWGALDLWTVGCGDTTSKDSSETVGGLTPRVGEEAVAVPATETNSVDQTRAPVSFAEAESVFHAKRYDEAVGLFKGFTEQKPENPWGHYMLGLSAWKSGNLDDAQSELSRAIELDSSHVKSRYNLARVYLESKQPEKALEQIQTAVTIDSGSAEGYRLLGRVREEMGHLDESVEAYRQALKVDGKDAWSMNNLAMVFIKQGRLERAIPVLALATQVKPDVSLFKNNLGMALELNGYFTEASKAYGSAVEADSSHLKAITNLARVSGLKDKPDLPGIDLVTLAESFAREIESWKVIATK